jgi:putative hemolysin
MAIEIVLIFLLLLLNGYLALSEIAIVSARRTRLQQQAERGDARARIAVGLSKEPTRFLSTVQIGITLVGVLSGAFGGAALSDNLTVWFATLPVVAPYAQGLAVGVVVVVISYFSVVVGELVPKRLALSDPERFAVLVARPMTMISRLAAPAVNLLESTSNLIFKVLRLPEGGEGTVTEADVTAMVAAGTTAGVFEPAERRIVERAFRLDAERVAAVMTPRRDIVWLDIGDSPAAHHNGIRAHAFSRFPVCDGSLDRLIGVLLVRDYWLAADGSSAPQVDIRPLLRNPLMIPESATALNALEEFQRTRIHLAFIVDEHGGLDGLVTLNNLLSFLVDSAEDVHTPVDERGIVRRADGSWLVDGSVSLGDFYAAVGVDDAEGGVRPYHTVAGLVMTQIGRIPATMDRVVTGPLTIEVADMDGYRIDKVLVTKTSPAAPAPADRD